MEAQEEQNKVLNVVVDQLDVPWLGPGCVGGSSEASEEEVEVATLELSNNENPKVKGLYVGVTDTRVEEEEKPELPSWEPLPVVITWFYNIPATQWFPFHEEPKNFTVKARKIHPQDKTNIHKETRQGLPNQISQVDKKNSAVNVISLKIEQDNQDQDGAVIADKGGVIRLEDCEEEEGDEEDQAVFVGATRFCNAC